MKCFHFYAILLSMSLIHQQCGKKVIRTADSVPIIIELEDNDQFCIYRKIIYSPLHSGKVRKKRYHIGSSFRRLIVNNRQIDNKEEEISVEIGDTNNDPPQGTFDQDRL